MKDNKNKTRCAWASGNPLFIKYHDGEWGVPTHDDKVHFEFLILEGAQAGLSWAIMMQKRKGYKKAFKNFNAKKVAAMTDAELEKLISDPSIVRNRLKIFSARKNARVFLAIQKEFGSFDKYIWQFVDGKTINGKRKAIKDLPARSKESDKLSKDLIKRGMSFVGSTIIYAHMQATGLVNDHTTDCWRYKSCL